jgi:hypothetical protein
MVKDSVGVVVVVLLAVGVGFAGFTDPEGDPIDGAAIGAAPHAPNPEMIISAQATSQARRPLLAGRTAPRSPPAHFTSLLAAKAVRTLGLSHRG